MSDLPESGAPDDDMLAAEYAMGLLEGDEHLAVRARVARDPGFAARVSTWEAQLSQLADLDPVAAPRATRAALMARLFPAPRRLPLWQRLGLWQALAGGAISAALLLAVVAFQPTEGTMTSALYSAEIASNEGDFRVVALVDLQADEVILARTAGAAPEGRILQVWAHGPDEPAQSVGLWPEGDSVRLRLPAEIAAVRGVLTLGVSEEPPGGSPTGRPSGRVFGTVDIPLIRAEL
ncbi:Anti-sigma-K factor RskA [[Luteovulum] sphaeroides subsp. megalophilum]|uniref:anti-sigma factor n=1 Tax=Cereibacter sphaeroides TaxID=1063 RepID=UPI000B6DFC38|nr:anti-sigma factor [Cereibacter sphaeroides]SNT22258.1 Anti-sigma-K factor RskA [[Luteovulum] sphaeroides subsp. megalophilum]